MKQFSLASSIAMLILTWSKPGLANQQFEVLIQSAILIQAPPVPAYRLRQQVTELAQDGDRLDAVGMAAQSAEWPMLLDLDRTRDRPADRQIRLFPHSRVRIIQLESLANGQKRVRLVVEQGQARLQLNPAKPRINPATPPIPACGGLCLTQLCHWVRHYAAVIQRRCCPLLPSVDPWYLNGLRAAHRIGYFPVEWLG